MILNLDKFLLIVRQITPIHLDQGNGKFQSDRSLVIGGKFLIGQLAPWVTWAGISDSTRIVSKLYR